MAESQPMLGAEAAMSPSEDLDSDSPQEASAAAPQGPPPGWFNDVEPEGSRWGDVHNEAVMNTWSASTAQLPRQPPFDPAPAFEQQQSEESGDSDSNRSDDGWQDKRPGGSSGAKRLRLDEAADQDVALATASETVTTGSEEPADDDERSSGEFEGASVGREDDVIRALGPRNVRELADMHAADLSALDADSEDGDPPYETPSESDRDSDAGAAIVCTNCTFRMDPSDAACPDCGHDRLDDALLFRLARSHFEPRPARGSTTILAYDDRLTEHEEGKPGDVHPERPDRIRAVIARLMTTGLADRCLRIPCRPATREELVACHKAHQVAKVEAASLAAGFSREELGIDRTYFTQDTYVRSSTFRCAALAAGGCVEVATAVARGEASNGAAIIRPPGHHAESGMAMGFCFFNNAAIAARAAQRAGAHKVLILDWDVHHGNGTQHIFEHDPTVLYMSIHRWDSGFFFPGTGGPHEVGKGAGEGFTVNVPWPCGNMGNGDYMAAFQHLVLPIAYEFAPDLVIVSAGFDAAEGDPLGGCQVTPEGFGHMTAMLAPVAPMALLLEGGYNLTATALGTEASLRVLLGERPAPLPRAGIVDPCAAAAIQNAVNRQSKYWRCLKPFVERLTFDPYASPFAETTAASPRAARSGSLSAGDVGSPRSMAAAAAAAPSQLLVPKPNTPSATRPFDITRAMRSKLATRHQGKSQRRLQYMHALHLVALKHKLRAHKAVSSRLKSGPELQRLASDVLVLPSPTRRAAGRAPTPFAAGSERLGTSGLRRDGMLSP